VSRALGGDLLVADRCLLDSIDIMDAGIDGRPELWGVEPSERRLCNLEDLPDQGRG
jgi:hypothetical protein